MKQPTASRALQADKTRPEIMELSAKICGLFALPARLWNSPRDAQRADNKLAAQEKKRPLMRG
jgi:hypothetical protein